MIDPAPPLAVERRGCTLVLTGDVDTQTAPLLIAAFRDATDVRQLELDVAAVSFIDSTGLRAILTEHRRRQADHLELVVLRPSMPVARLLELTGLVSYLRVDPPLSC